MAATAPAIGGDYAKLNKLLLIAGLVYFLWPQIKQAFASLGVQVPDLSRLLPVPSNILPAGFFSSGDSSSSSPTTAAPGGGGGAGIGGIAGAASSIIGGAAGAGASALAIGLTAGVAAVGAIIAWGVIKQGWFRGGQEGVVVNPARDQFLAQFAPLDYMRDGRNPPGFYGMAWLLEALSPGNGTGGAFAALTGAHTKAQLESAVSIIQGIIAANRAKAEQLWEYARRDSAAPQRSVTVAA